MSDFMKPLDEQVDAIVQLLHELDEDPGNAEKGDNICYLIDEIWGKNTERGLLNKEGSLESLEELSHALKELIADAGDGLHPNKRKKFEAYISMVDDRIRSNVTLIENRQRLEAARQRTHGDFSAIAGDIVD